MPPPPPSLAQRIRDHEWYHTLELAPGVVTPGWFDLRPIADQVGFPSSLAGARCLDVATFDGFWAFEMERRGADEVVAIDVLDPAQWDWPVASSSEEVATVGSRKGRGEGFILAAEALGSSVTRHEMSVYDLDPAALGTFDVVYLGSLLLHLRDPVRALGRVREVCRGKLLLVDAINVRMSVLHPRQPVASLEGIERPWWWKPNIAALARMVESAGFTVVGQPKRIDMPPGAAWTGPSFAKDWRDPRAVVRALSGRKGDPHAVVSAVPAPPR